jgi:hypothetical protein
MTDGPENTPGVGPPAEFAAWLSGAPPRAPTAARIQASWDIFYPPAGRLWVTRNLPALLAVLGLVALLQYHGGADDRRLDREPVAQAQARITSVRSSYDRIAGDYVVLEYRYRPRAATTYRPGRSYTGATTLTVGALAPLEHLVAEPSISRLQGLRARPYGVQTEVLWLIGLGVAALVALLLRLHGRRHLLERLLRNGVVVPARILQVSTALSGRIDCRVTWQTPTGPVPGRLIAPPGPAVLAALQARRDAGIPVQALAEPARGPLGLLIEALP